MANEEKTRNTMLEIFKTIDAGLKWAEEWAEICVKLTPTQKNIESQYDAIAKLENKIGR